MRLNLRVIFYSIEDYRLTEIANAKKKLLCKEIFSNDQLQEFRRAIDRNYIFEMFIGNYYFLNLSIFVLLVKLLMIVFPFLSLTWIIEDFIVGNMIGHVKENKHYLATHLNFNILYNKALGVISISYTIPILLENYQNYSGLWLCSQCNRNNGPYWTKFPYRARIHIFSKMVRDFSGTTYN